MKSIKIAALIIAILLAVLLVSCSSKKVEPKEVSTAPVNEVKNTVEASGIVKVSNSEDIVIDMPMQAATRVEKVFVREGQRVKKGDKLVELDLSDYNTLIKQKTKAMEADQILKKDMQTYNQKTAQNLKIQGERAELDSLKNKINRSYLKSENIVCNFDNAVVMDLSCSQGDVVSSQQKVLSLHDLSALFIEANVDEEFIKDVKVGSSVTIIPKADPKLTLTGRVTRIYNEAVTQNGEIFIPVEISMNSNNGILLPNYNVDVEISKN